MSYAPLQTSRAAFCELLASECLAPPHWSTNFKSYRTLNEIVKVLRTFPHPEQEADLVGQLVKGWCAFDGAPEDVWLSMGEDRKDIEGMRGSALEVGQARFFPSVLVRLTCFSSLSFLMPNTSSPFP